MQLHEVESNVAGLDMSQSFDLVYDLLRAYGVSNASISRLRSGSYDKAEYENELLWKEKVFYRFIDNGDDLHDAIDEARHDELIGKHRPRFLIVRDERQIVAVDTRTNDTLDAPLVELSSYSAFFLPWAGIEKTQLESINYADVTAAEKMARLYDEIVAHNRFDTAADVHRLNVFFSRLLFCFFAEDTGVFADGVFTNGIASLTSEDGSDTARYLDELFEVLDLEPKKRNGIPKHFSGFGYVNGKLFSAPAAAPVFMARARRLILECGTLNWSIVNPDIFGSMMQAVVHPGQRESLGMHYTSVENIMKVIRPLFLDDLEEAVDQASTKAKLERLLKRISEIKVFDPACGSGNFLVIAYKELRKLEHRILERIAALDPNAPGSLFQLSQIKLENFFGIEIDDFAHEIAILSLWLAKHQMNIEFRDLFGVEISLIPLKDTGNIVSGNAARLSWEEVCPIAPTDEVYILGNPPYLGSRNQKPEHKSDLKLLSKKYKSLDYVSIWFIKASPYIAGTRAQVAFVATNSITQGEQVGILWPDILKTVEIGFAHRSFKWTNNARGGAGVTCVVVSLRPPSSATRFIYTDGHRAEAKHINAYLTDADDIYLGRRSSPLSREMPPCLYGSMPNDGGHLILETAAKDRLLNEHPEAERFVRPFIGSAELLKGHRRWCLVIEDADVLAARKIPEIDRRLEGVTLHRRASTEASTKRLAERPNQFYFFGHQDTESLIIPNQSSERRDYLPIDYSDGRAIASNACNVVYGARPHVFGLVSSRMHMTWIRAVAGRLKTDIRYSGTLVYNNFPTPSLDESQADVIGDSALEILECREMYSGNTLADLYDPRKMPTPLRQAHEALDQVVDRAYSPKPFEGDEDRLSHLFQRYERMSEVAGDVNAEPG